MVLTKMKETAEQYLGHEITHAVVTVPGMPLVSLFPFYLSFSASGSARLESMEMISTTY